MKIWNARQTLGAVAVAAAIAGVGGAAIAAATGSGSGDMPGGRHGGGPPFSANRFGDAEPDTLHGESVVADGHGGFTTKLTQTGDLTAVSLSSATARSEDGLVQTYEIGPAEGTNPPTFHVGDRVTIEAERRGPTAVLTTIRPSH